MPRIARDKGEYQTYHIIQRGNEKKNIFVSEGDRNRFVDILRKMKGKYNFKLEAYCLMDNHVHLLINDNGNDISKIVKSINISYAYYFNHMYQRVGHLFQDRFKSEIITDENYLLVVSAYIHNNPVKAGIVKSVEQYKWSSFNYYTGRGKNIDGLVDTERILGMFSNSRKKAEDEYNDFVNKYEHKNDILDVEDDKILFKKDNVDFIVSYDNAKQMVSSILIAKGKHEEDLKADKELRYEIILRLRQNSSLTLKEIGHLAGGVSQSMICKILSR